MDDARIVRDFYRAVLMLDTVEEVDAFFRDLCTDKERVSMAQRLEVAKLLRIRKTYSEIEHETNASTATISRVKRSMKVANGKGYDLVLPDLIKKDLERQRKTAKEKSTPPGD